MPAKVGVVTAERITSNRPPTNPQSLKTAVISIKKMRYTRTASLNSMLERENWRHLADYLRQELYVGENIYVFQAENGQRAVSWRSGTESSLGEWVQGIMENNQWDRRPDGITLRDIYYDFYTGKELQLSLIHI